MKTLLTGSSGIALLLLAAIQGLPVSAQTLTDTPPPANWTRFIDDCRGNPAFAGLNGHHVVSGSFLQTGIIKGSRGYQYSFGYQSLIQSTGTGYSIGYADSRIGDLKNREVHGIISQNFRLGHNRNNFISAGIETYLFKPEYLFPTNLEYKITLNGLPEINAGILFHSEQFYAGIVLKNLSNTYQTIETPTGESEYEVPVTGGFYSGYKTKSGFGATLAIHHHELAFSMKSIELGLFKQVKKVLLIGAKLGRNYPYGSFLNLHASYMGKSRLRAGGSVTLLGWSSPDIVANISYVLGKPGL